MTKSKKLVDAQRINEKRTKGEQIKAGDLKLVIIYVLPVSGFPDTSSRYTTRPSIEARLAQLERIWCEYIPESDIIIEPDVVTEDVGLTVLV